MRQLTITLITPDGMELENTQLPDDMKTEEIISELRDQLRLDDLSPAGDPVRYFLVILGRDITLAPGQSLRDAGLENGDKLRLMASQRVESSGEVISAPNHNDAFIRVHLSVLDLNRSEEVTLPADQPVQAIIADIFARQKRAGKSKLNINDYRLHSKARAQFLLPAETLRSAGIPQGDLLSIHKNEPAGAGGQITMKPAATP